MNNIIVFVMGLLCFGVANAHEVSKEQAVRISMKFILENGYTKDDRHVKEKIDFEMLDDVNNRRSVLALRRNTLKNRPAALMYEKNTKTWFVCFDYVKNNENLCRVVSVSSRGAPKIEHRSGIKSYFIKHGYR